jgi:hypothetical protein
MLAGMAQPQDEAQPIRQSGESPLPRVVHKPDMRRMVAALMLILEQGRQQAREREKNEKSAS